MLIYIFTDLVYHSITTQVLNTSETTIEKLNHVQKSAQQLTLWSMNLIQNIQIYCKHYTYLAAYSITRIQINHVKNNYCVGNLQQVNLSYKRFVYSLVRITSTLFTSTCWSTSFRKTITFNLLLHKLSQYAKMTCYSRV